MSIFWNGVIHFNSSCLDFCKHICLWKGLKMHLSRSQEQPSFHSEIAKIHELPGASGPQGRALPWTHRVPVAPALGFSIFSFLNFHPCTLCEATSNTEHKHDTCITRFNILTKNTAPENHPVIWEQYWTQQNTRVIAPDYLCTSHNVN